MASMAGRVVVEGDDLCFVPRFAFVEGTAYSAVVDGTTSARLVRPRIPREPTAEVVAIRPDVEEVPRNLLRVYVEFSSSMAEGQASSQVRLLDDRGAVLDHALLVVEDELWDRDRCRLTVLLDPARIKRGLAAHRSLGYPLRSGEAVRIVVGDGFLDAGGAPLRHGAERRFLVGGDERRTVDPGAWVVVPPAAGSCESLRVDFDRPLDHGLLVSCLSVVDAEGRAVAGVPAVGPGGRSWAFSPVDPWTADDHRLIVDPRLEDLAGNSVLRVFDRDLSDPSAVTATSDDQVVVGFRPGGDRAE